MLQALPSLLELDISWNSLVSYHDDVAVMQQHCPALSTLDARNNPWYKVMRYFWLSLKVMYIILYLAGIIFQSACLGASAFPD